MGSGEWEVGSGTGFFRKGSTLLLGTNPTHYLLPTPHCPEYFKHLPPVRISYGADQFLPVAGGLGRSIETLGDPGDHFAGGDMADEQRVRIGQHNGNLALLKRRQC